MLNLSREVELMRERGLLTPEAAAHRLAIEQREIFSVQPELKIMSWAGAMLVAAGVSMLVGKNYERIGPAVIATVVGVLAVACYLVSWVRRSRSQASLIDDYIVLLGALLISADLGFIEKGILKSESEWFLLALVVLHGVAAYVFESRAVLSLALASLASWFGVRQFEPVTVATNAFICSALILMWRVVDQRGLRARATSFTPVFDHFAANVAFWGALSLAFRRDTSFVGALITVVLAAIVIRYGFAVRSEAFVIYSYIYAVIAIDALVVHQMWDDESIVFLYFVISSIAAIVGLFVIHARFRRTHDAR